MDWSSVLDNDDALEREDAGWRSDANVEVCKQMLSWVPPDTTTILDVGCGTGVLLSYSTALVKIGIDKQPKCVSLARERNPEAVIVCGDVRNWLRVFRSEVVVCKAVLKHFSLWEWDQILSQLFEVSQRMVLFTMNVGDRKDDGGNGIHHTYVPTKDIAARVDDLGGRIIDVVGNPVEPVFVCGVNGC